jgi:hypothetical protein
VDQRLGRGEEMRGVQRGEHEELAKNNGKVGLIKAVGSGQMAYKQEKM